MYGKRTTNYPRVYEDPIGPRLNTKPVSPVIIRRLEREYKARMIKLQEISKKVKEHNKAMNDALHKANKEHPIVKMKRGVKRNRLAIERQIAHKHNITRREMLSKSRKSYVTAARFELFYQIRVEFPNMTLPRIGQIYGLDHTSVLNAIRKHCRRHGLEEPKKAVPVEMENICESCGRPKYREYPSRQEVITDGR